MDCINFISKTFKLLILWPNLFDLNTNIQLYCCQGYQLHMDISVGYFEGFRYKWYNKSIISTKEYRPVMPKDFVCCSLILPRCCCCFCICCCSYCYSYSYCCSFIAVEIVALIISLSFIWRFIFSFSSSFFFFCYPSFCCCDCCPAYRYVLVYI